jgi:hypothetical protein
VREGWVSGGDAGGKRNNRNNPRDNQSDQRGPSQQLLFLGAAQALWG